MPEHSSSTPTAVRSNPPEGADPPTIIWEQLTQCIEAFAQAWNGAAEPPELLHFVPASPPMLRRLALIELVKVDLEWRWQRPQWRKLLEQYAAELPELCEDGGMPNELVYEELHVRKEHGENDPLAECSARFPEQAALLSALLATDQAAHGTSVRKRHKTADFKPGQAIDDFDLLATLGQGAFGSVFLALQRSLARIVALKITADHGFETQTMAQLDHPYIVRVYDRRQIGELGLQLIYMQVVPGGTLQAVVRRVCDMPPRRRSGKLLLNCIDSQLVERNEVPPTDSRTRHFLEQCSWPEAVCWLGARLAEALEHAHARGVLHRDLKPANVLLAADGSPKLADFNISSCATLPGASAAAYFGGSLAYMSPEQLEIYSGKSSRGPESLDARSDLYSLGVVLWELLMGQRPFSEDMQFNLSGMSLLRMLELRRKGLTEAAVCNLPSDCPRGLVEALRQCLAAEPSERFANARQLRRQLDLALQSDAYQLVRPPRQGVVRALARHPLPPLLALAVLPNLGASALNIAYNVPAILRQVDHPMVPQVFRIQVMTINPIAFSLGITLITALAWSVLRAVKARSRDDQAVIEQPARTRERSLHLGDYVAWVSGTEWLISGVIFPVWLHIALGSPAALDASQYLHFLASQSICGLLAVTMSFFLVTLFSLKVITPRLLDPDEDDTAMHHALGRLASRTSLHTGLTFMIVPLALVAISVAHIELRSVFSILGIVGLGAWAVAIVLARQIQRCISALQRAVDLQSSSHATGGVDSPSSRLGGSAISRV